MNKIHSIRFFLIVIVLFFALPLFGQQSDVFEDASAYGYDLKQQTEDEIFFYESRLVDIGLHIGGRTFTGNLGKLFGTGFNMGGFFTYFFTKQLALEVTINNSWHEFLIDGKRGTATLFDILGRGKFYFVSETYSKALTFANPYIFIGGGQFIRHQQRKDISIDNTSSGPGIEFGGGLEIPLKERQIFLGIKPSYQLIFIQDESDRTDRGTQLNGDAVSFVASFTYSF